MSEMLAQSEERANKAEDRVKTLTSDIASARKVNERESERSISTGQHESGGHKRDNMVMSALKKVKR